MSPALDPMQLAGFQRVLSGAKSVVVLTGGRPRSPNAHPMTPAQPLWGPPGHLSATSLARPCAGAGVSAESGIPTFRGAGGLWRTYDATTLGVCTQRCNTAGRRLQAGRLAGGCRHTEHASPTAPCPLSRPAQPRPRPLRATPAWRGSFTPGGGRWGLPAGPTRRTTRSLPWRGNWRQRAGGLHSSPRWGRHQVMRGGEFVGLLGAGAADEQMGCYLCGRVCPCSAAPEEPDTGPRALQPFDACGSEACSLPTMPELVVPRATATGASAGCRMWTACTRLPARAMWWSSTAASGMCAGGSVSAADQHEPGVLLLPSACLLPCLLARCWQCHIAQPLLAWCPPQGHAVGFEGRALLGGPHSAAGASTGG